MMKKIFALLLAVLLLAVTVSAETPFMVDDAKLMTTTAANDLESEFSRYYEDYGFTVAAQTTRTFGDKYAADYTKAAYLQAQYSNDGVLLVISEQEGQWYLYTSGICAEAISDEMVAQIGRDLQELLETGNYYDALKQYAEASAQPVIEVIEARTEAAKETQKWNKRFVLLGMLGGLVVGIMVVLTLSAKKKPAENQEEKAEKKARRMAKKKDVQKIFAEETPEEEETAVEEPAVEEPAEETVEETTEAAEEEVLQEMPEEPETEPAQEAVEAPQEIEEDPFERELQEMWDLLKNHTEQEDQTTV